MSEARGQILARIRGSFKRGQLGSAREMELRDRVAAHRRNLVPAASDLSIKELGGSLVRHLRFERPGKEEAWSYNVLQRLTYLLVIFVLFPLMIWTGLAMSFGFTSEFPLAVRLLGGQQTARSLHFLVTILLVLFLLIHVLMVFVAGFRNRMRAMITGRATPPTE